MVGEEVEEPVHPGVVPPGAQVVEQSDTHGRLLWFRVLREAEGFAAG